jgi:two-component system chemotaxis response regulator CheY
MKILIAEDEPVSAALLKEILVVWGTVDVAVDGLMAMEMYEKAHDARKMYDLICLDIMMPHLSGQQVLEKIRIFEIANGIGGREMVPIIMTTALSDEKNVMKAFVKGACEGYVVKPMNLAKLKKELLRLQLID